jgi:hypothetical protein
MQRSCAPLNQPNMGGCRPGVDSRVPNCRRASRVASQRSRGSKADVEPGNSVEDWMEPDRCSRLLAVVSCALRAPVE